MLPELIEAVGVETVEALHAEATDRIGFNTIEETIWPLSVRSIALASRESGNEGVRKQCPFVPSDERASRESADGERRAK